MLANISTKNLDSVDRKYRRFIHELDCAYMNRFLDAKDSSLRIGRVLRALRIARNWTLEDFEKASGGKIKSVVLGSYERGSRSISVNKLQAIAAIYEVPISGFFNDHNDRPLHDLDNVVIDLRKLRETLIKNPSKFILHLNHFTAGIIDLRRDWNGEILSIRNSDLNYLAIMSNSSAEKILNEYSSHNVIFKTRD